MNSISHKPDSRDDEIAVAPFVNSLDTKLSEALEEERTSVHVKRYFALFSRILSSKFVSAPFDTSKLDDNSDTMPSKLSLSKE